MITWIALTPSKTENLKLKMNFNSLHIQVMSLARQLLASEQITCYHHSEEKLILCEADNTITEFNIAVAKKPALHWVLSASSKFKAPFSCRVVQMCSNKAGTFIRTEFGEVYCKGIDIFKHGVLGLGDNFIVSQLTRIPIPDPVKSFAVSSKHGVALSGEIMR